MKRVTILTTSSNTKVKVSGVCIMSCKVTMLECFNPFNKEAGKEQILKIKKHYYLSVSKILGH